MFEREKYNLEFKEKISKTFLKTISAFSNYNDGKIIFGISDYEEKKSSNQNLDFEILELKLKDIVGIENLSLDILKTLS